MCMCICVYHILYIIIHGRQGTVLGGHGLLIQELPKLGQQHSQDKDLRKVGKPVIFIAFPTMKPMIGTNDYLFTWFNWNF